MAVDITVNLNDRYEAIVNRAAADYNTANAGTPGFVAVTPAQWFRQSGRELLDVEAGRQEQADKEAPADATGLRTAYKRAPLNVQSVVDAALAPYR
jgi:hypothetical protein